MVYAASHFAADIAYIISCLHPFKDSHVRVEYIANFVDDDSDQSTFCCDMIWCQSVVRTTTKVNGKT